MLTGDRREVGEAVAGKLGLDEVHAELLPADKVERVEKLLGELPDNKKLAFVGDGINGRAGSHESRYRNCHGQHGK